MEKKTICLMKSRHVSAYRDGLLARLHIQSCIAARAAVPKARRYPPNAAQRHGTIWRGVPSRAAIRCTSMENTGQDFGRPNGRRASCGSLPRNDLAAGQAAGYAFLRAIFMAVPAVASGSRRIPWSRGRAPRGCLPRRQKAALVPACPAGPAIRGRESDYPLFRCRRRPP